MLSCLIIAKIYGEAYSPFLYASGICLVISKILYFVSRLNKKKTDSIQKKDAYLTVTLSWLQLGILGSLPYIFSGYFPTITDALFESISGFTTTGSSILTDIEALPKSLLFWRSLTHWIGGIGIIILVVAVLPSLKIGGYHLFSSESSLQDKIKPRIRQVGNRLLLIYLSLTVAEILLLMLGDMNLFESICHAFGTVATGGFSPKNTSIAEYSPYIQYVITVFMFLAGANFVVHYFAFKGDFKSIFQNEEFKYYSLIVLVIGFTLTLSLYSFMDKDFEESFRESFFQIVSIITCTGFASADYMLWPTFAWLIIFGSMFIGGSTGSTAGGIKVARHIILFKNIRNSFKSIFHPRGIFPVKLNNTTLKPNTNNTIKTFIVSYIAIFGISSILIIGFGVDGQTATSAVATCMAGIGPGIGTVGPANNFYHLPDIVKIILSFVMIVGRLEIYTILILFTRGFWRN